MSDDLDRLLDAWGRSSVSQESARLGAGSPKRFLAHVAHVRRARAFTRAGLTAGAGIIVFAAICWVLMREVQRPAPTPPEPPLRAIDR